jgi:transcriptional regulator of acetoin/glycerol metabolism
MAPPLQSGITYQPGNNSGLEEIKSRLETLWNHLATTQSVPEENLRPPIVDSWQRCLHLKVDLRAQKPEQASPEEIEYRLNQNREYIKAIEPVIACVSDLVIESDYVISFADWEGYVLTIYGSSRLKKLLQQVNFIVGTRWTERSIGTTALGIALATKQPSQVFHAEHYCEGLHNFSCTAVPVRDLFSQEFIGVLDFAGFLQDHQPHAMGMALQMGRCIELEIYKNRNEQNEFFRECSTQLSLDYMERGVLILDENNIVRRANLKAVEYLDVKSNEVLGVPFKKLTVFSKWKDFVKPFTTSISGTKIIRVERKPLQHHKKPIGFLIFLERVRDDIRVEPTRKSTAVWKPVGESSVFKMLLQTAENSAQYDSNVLITGKTGTGKEIIARYIHQTSPRKSKPFVAINCGSIPKDLLGSELFGYEAGAFTGAKQKGHPSKFELANGGTLLLDEISEMPLESQVYLLRAIEEKTITRLGGSKPIEVEIRIIASANRDLEKEVEAGRFRADLLFRLNVLRIDLPSLQDRKEDIPLLADYFLQDLSKKMKQNLPSIREDAMTALMNYHWPGNVRELRNTIEQAIVMCHGDSIDWECIPHHIRNGSHNSEGIPEKERERYAAFVKAFNDSKGNISRMAKLLNVSRPTVYAWKKKFGVD